MQFMWNTSDFLYCVPTPIYHIFVEKNCVKNVQRLSDDPISLVGRMNLQKIKHTDLFGSNLPIPTNNKLHTLRKRFCYFFLILTIDLALFIEEM